MLSAKKKASDCLDDLTKLLSKKSAKKDLVVPALTKALACLKEGKALKAQLNKALKAWMKGAEPWEPRSRQEILNLATELEEDPDNLHKSL